MDFAGAAGYITGMIPRSLRAGLALLVAACSRPSDGWVVPRGAGQATGPTIRILGTVRHLELEGGFFAIRSDDDVTYDPTNLPKEFREDGLRVEAEGRRLEETVGTRQVGPIVELTRIRRRTTDGTPTAVAGASPSGADRLTDALADRVWIRTDSTGMPGVARVFLGDGTLIMDSCWETYRLAPWRALGDSAVSWTEDGATIRAGVTLSGPDRLTLRLALTGGTEEEHYRRTSAPFVCPEMRR
jgi:hypothetical protein